METIKKHRTLISLLVLVCIIVLLSVHDERRDYQLADFGIPPLVKSDCSSVKDKNINSPVTISFNAPDVSLVRAKINALITKHDGHITSDSFSSYPSLPPLPGGPNAGSQDNLNITVSFDTSQSEFLAELSSLVKSSGGMDTGYSYTDGNPDYGAYSPYASCLTLVQAVQADVLQLEILVKALKEERDTAHISLLSQSISMLKNTLITDVGSANSFFTASDKPLVNISVYTLQK